VTEAPAGAYWVRPGRLLAGGYPRELDCIREAGVTLFLDLTEEGEYGLAPYAALLAAATRAVRKPVPDFSCPAPERMTEILDLLDTELEAGSVVYVHCYGGVGRTGTVVGCWLVRHGATGEEALEEIARLRGGPAPETVEQRELILAWAEIAGESPDRGMRPPPVPS
jgi:Cyclin-dependent kinase inhibitor 3 (CDKN3)